MGPLVGGLAALGSGSAVAGGITLATAAVGVYSAFEQVKAGQALAAEKKQEAVREGDAARQEEIERRRSLMSVLAQRSAAAGAAGVTTDGSIGALTRRDIRDNRNDLGISNANTAARQRALRGQAKSAIRTSRAGAAGSLLDSAGKLYEARG